MYVEAQRGSERPREAQRGPERHRDAQKGPWRPTEAQRGAEWLREAQIGSERSREAQKGPEMLGEAVFCCSGTACGDPCHFILYHRTMNFCGHRQWRHFYMSTDIPISFDFDATFLSGHRLRRRGFLFCHRITYIHMSYIHTYTHTYRHTYVHDI